MVATTKILTVPCLTFALLEFSAFDEYLNVQINTRRSRRRDFLEGGSGFMPRIGLARYENSNSWRINYNNTNAPKLNYRYLSVNYFP